MKHRKFSIIVSTLNAEKNFATMLNSLLGQSFTDFEVLIQDGGSTDGTLHVAKHYASLDSRFIVRSEKDRGIYEALNKGIKRAAGEWLLFMGGDDSLYDKDVLANVNDTIAKDRSLQFVYGDVKLNKSIGFNTESLVFAGEFHSNRLLTCNICHQAIFYHHSLFETFGLYDPKYRLLADWDFNLRCFNRVHHRYLGLIVANFFVGASSAQGNDIQFKKDFIRNMIFRYPYSRTHPFYKKTKRALSGLLLHEAFSGHLKKAFVVTNVLFRQLKSSAKAKSF